MAFQGEYFIRRYGGKAAEALPPVRRMLAGGVPVGAGTDGTRVASYHPWTCLYWLVSGKTVGGTEVTAATNRLGRAEALELYTRGSAWFSAEEEKKGRLKEGWFADLAVLDRDYFHVEENEIRSIESELTVLGGRIVHAAGPFVGHNPALPPVSPDWSPVARWGGFANCTRDRGPGHAPCAQPGHGHTGILGADGRLWRTGCGCAVF